MPSPRPQFARLLLQQFNRWYVELVLLLAVAVLLTGFLLVIQPKLQTVRVQGRTSLQASQRYVSELERYRDDLIRVSTGVQEFSVQQRQKLQAVLPREVDFPGLLVQMQTLAQRNGFALHHLDLNPGSVSEEADTPTTGLGELTIGYTISGQGYERLKQFLTEVQRNLRLFDVTSVTFSEAMSGPFSISMKTYYLP